MKLLLTMAAILAPLFSQSLDEAVQSYEKKDYKAAELTLRELVNADPDNGRAQLYLGLALASQGRIKDAKPLFLKARGLLKDSDAAEVGLAKVYIDARDFEKAQQSLDSARSINPDNADLPYNQGMVDLGRQDYSAAAKNFEIATGMDSGNAYAHYYAGLAYNSLKRPDKMIEHFTAFLKLAPDAPEAKKVQSILKVVR